MAHLLPTAIFSPSVARKQFAVAKEWNYVDDWLSTKFDGKPIPPFERNSDTLNTLLALAVVNETADEENDLLSKFQAKALQDLQAAAARDPNVTLLDSLEKCLTREGHFSLEAISSLSITLNRPLPEIEKLGRCLLDLQVKSNALELSSDRLTTFETHLNAELEDINSIVRDLQSEAYEPQTDPTKQAIHYQRKIKQIASKLPELRDRVSLLSTSVESPNVTIHDVKSEESQLKDLIQVVRGLEMEVDSFYGLPQDIELARLELESLRVELLNLTRKRESMFEGLGERTSPKKI